MTGKPADEVLVEELAAVIYASDPVPLGIFTRREIEAWARAALVHLRAKGFEARDAVILSKQAHKDGTDGT